MQIDKTYYETLSFAEKAGKFGQKTENKFLVLHNIAIPEMEKIIETFKKFQASCHYIINPQGQIFQLVDEKEIAYHAGISYWNGNENLNQNSVGIEFINPDSFGQNFPQIQLESGIQLCKDIIKRNNIEQRNIVGHSDIAYFPNEKPYLSFGINGQLNRKQDPSHLFDWAYLAKNGIGLWYDKSQIDFNNIEIEFALGQKSPHIVNLKKKLKNIGYKTDLTDYFDMAFKNLIIVFCRRFIPHKLAFAHEGQWLKIFSQILNLLEREYER